MVESEILEFKRSVTDDFEKEIVAFLNTLGGVLYLGLDDTGTVVGFNNVGKQALAVIDRIKNNICPSSLGLFNVETMSENRKGYIKITVAQGPEKPFYLKEHGLSPRGCYLRVGSQTTAMSQEMIDSLYARRVRNSLANVPSPHQNLTFTRLRIHYAEKGFDASSEFFLKNLDLYTPGGQFNYIAFLMADTNNISVKVARFRGSDKIDIVERNEYGYTCLLEVVRLVLGKLEMVNATIVRVGGEPERKEIHLVDKHALREAVLNALVHNDYLRTSPAFEIYDNRIDVLSCGGLPLGLSEEEFFKGRSLPRSRELMRIFADMDLSERLGSGMQKILRVYPKNIFEISENFVLASFPFSKEALKILHNQTPDMTGEHSAYHVSQLSAQALKVLALLKEKGQKTGTEIAEELRLTKNQVSEAAIELRSHGLIDKESSGYIVR
ncbi:MAG: RNA-binding domain-containing protein [Sphaerochaeta sp.]|jgi:ATP-dependent DNA helicase RecG|nr:transcriptional regulator [Spirochaetales bacterium]